jgi:hypothetical protein
MYCTVSIRFPGNIVDSTIHMFSAIFALLINNHSIVINFVKLPYTGYGNTRKNITLFQMRQFLPCLIFSNPIKYFFRQIYKSDFGGRKSQLGPDKIKRDTVCIINIMLWKKPAGKAKLSV